MEGRPNHYAMQLAKRIQRCARRDRFLIMHGMVAELADQVHLRGDPRTDVRLELRNIDPRRQVILIRNRQRQLVFAN